MKYLLEAPDELMAAAKAEAGAREVSFAAWLREAVTEKLERSAGEESCERCEHRGPRWHFNIHHQDRDRQNNAVENLERLCIPCHRLEHASDTRSSFRKDGTPRKDSSGIVWPDQRQHGWQPGPNGVVARLLDRRAS